MKKNNTRILVQRGKKNYSLKIEEIAMFMSIKKMVYAIDRTNEKYACRGNLVRFESMLDKRFFRANRQFIINIEHLEEFATFEKVKIQLKMRLPGENDAIIVSQETAQRFRKWITSL
ncbi:MAG TPA: LytTR family DNA-binding domain-containing protein [Chitinophagaceae bacterium]|jgi:DNA-binding LytR/AlgR family response regulator